MSGSVEMGDGGILGDIVVDFCSCFEDVMSVMLVFGKFGVLEL